MNAVKEQLEIMLKKFKEGHLAETDIVSALLLADDTEVSPRQSLLYLQVPTTHPYAAVIGISIFEEGKKHSIFFRTLGNVIMLVPPLAISNNEINLLVDGALKTIKGISK